MTGIKKILLISILICNLFASAQISQVHITYERKINLHKKYKDSQWVLNYVKDEEKIKSDFFELFVTDTMTVFRPVESDLREKFSWLTSRNTVYQNLNKGERYLIKTMWGEELHIRDTLISRKWHITESSRKIAGYTCRKAVWRANDSTRIYAWFSYEITPSVGPESFRGLPGTILGLATEDGGVVYFATKVNVVKPEQPVFLIPKKKKIWKMKELRADLEKRFGTEKWFRESMHENFGIW